MFSLMTALLSPKVMEALDSRKEALFQTLTERAGVLCVQPSSGICMLQGEWDSMKKAHVVLEEFCLQVQAQNTVQALLKAREKAYNDMQANYHKMAEEAIKGFSRDSPPHSQGSAESGAEDGHNHQDGEGFYKPDQERMIAEIQQRAIAAQQRAAFEAQRVALEGADGQPENNEDTQEKMDEDGGKSESDQTKAVTPSDLTSSATPGGGSVEQEEDRDSEGGLQIALSEGEETTSPHSQEHGEAQNLSVRRNSHDTEGSAHSPYTNSYGQSQMPSNGGDQPRPFDPYTNTSQPPELSSELKPDIGQLRAMAQFYAMQQSVFNYGYLSVEARKVLEARMAAGASPHELVSVGLQYPGQAPPTTQDASGLTSPLTSPSYAMAPTDLSLITRRPDNCDSDKPPNGKDGGDGVHSLHKYARADVDDDPVDAAGAGGGGNYIGRTDWPAALKNYSSLPIPGTSNPPTLIPVGGGSNPYECPACLAKFPNRDAVQEHMLQAHAVGPGLHGEKATSATPPVPASQMADAYCCPVCGKFYKSGQRLREHILLHDKNYQRPQYPCPACGKTFTYRHNMKVHFQKIHKGKQPIKRHECGICGQKFHKPVYLRHHLLRHKEALYGTGVGPFGNKSSPTQVPTGPVTPLENRRDPTQHPMITNQSATTSS